MSEKLLVYFLKINGPCHVTLPLLKCWDWRLLSIHGKQMSPYGKPHNINSNTFSLFLKIYCVSFWEDLLGDLQLFIPTWGTGSPLQGRHVTRYSNPHTKRVKECETKHLTATACPNTCLESNSMWRVNVCWRTTYRNGNLPACVHEHYYRRYSTRMLWWALAPSKC